MATHYSWSVNSEVGSSRGDSQFKMADVHSVNGSVGGRRMRTTFTSRQLLELERQFAANMYLSRLRRIQISTFLQLSEKQIKVWFQNRRVRFKKERVEEDDVCHDDDVSGSERACRCARQRVGRRHHSRRLHDDDVAWYRDITQPL